MDITLIIIIAIGIACSLLTAYKLKPAGTLSKLKPSFCFLPKFKLSLTLSSDIMEAKNPQKRLINRLATFGFSILRESEDKLILNRGSALGDFSIKIAKINITFDLPLRSLTSIEVEYGSFAAFDTGDLWQFSQELKKSLEYPR
ncbi:MAG: hypothetical protein ACQ9MH_02045 [Nitrospinales bacterium]